MASINLDIARFEVSGVYSQPDAKVDIVLVHGLNGDPKRTWTSKTTDVFWPTDLLPASLRDRHANVLVYGYNADVYSRTNDRSASDNFVFQHAQTLVTHLTTYRKSEGTTTNPIIWVAHSLGGILVKRALLYSNDVRATHHEEYRSIYVSTYGIIFLGTPHTGSSVATWGRMLQAMSDAVVPRKLFESESVLLKTLKHDSERLYEINNHFLDIYQRFKIHMAHENHKTDLKGRRTLVVEADSASPQLPGVTYYGIEATHSGLCKFDSANAPGYRTVSTALRDWVGEAPPVIVVRWNMEEEDREARVRRDIAERRLPFLDSPELKSKTTQPMAIESAHRTPPPSYPVQDTTATSPMPLLPISARPGLVGEPDSQIKNDPLFLHPEPFRPNSYFVGRETELKDLHANLMDRHRRAQGTSAVLIQSLPGGGKTHLARQYVYQHRADYPGGIYWVRAKSVTEMEQFYWRIAKNEALRDVVPRGSSKDQYDARAVVDLVRKWFNGLENWLIVFDGIRFDTTGIQRFIPDARNTSVIYTSTERSVTGDYEFDNPQIMELGLLSAQEAQDLLLLEMDKKQPWTQDDRSRANELAQLMGRLPLMIHVAAQHLKATREPLSRYLRAYRSRPKVGALPAYRAVWDQLKSRGANPALNLMSILVFYDQHIPVGMLSLGLGALDIRTPVLTRDASHKIKSLNNSLKILIAFALVERTETDNVSPTSSRSSKTSDRAVEYIDILRIHSVVQAFFMETLAEEKEHHFWLERATRVFCRSFDEADQRIHEEPKLGLADDYRRYAVHGRRLLEHLHRQERKAPPYLSTALRDLEDRLDHVYEAIQRLSQAAQAKIISGYEGGEDKAVPVSVFDRTSSLSETDSATPSTQRSLTATDRWVPVGGEDAVQHQSPTVYSPHDFNPYHFHVPYPQNGTIPVPVFEGEGHNDGDDDDDADDRTEVPSSSRGTPRVSGGPLSPLSPTSDGGWTPVGPRHRTVEKSERRRYHDRGGAWRNQGVGDPRISVSREIAKGSIFRARDSSKSPHRARVTAESDAELTLNEIKKTSPLSPRLSGPAPGKARAASPTPSAPGPRLILGGSSYADVLAGKTSAADVAMSPTEFSNGFFKSSTAALKRLKENIFQPGRTKSTEHAKPAKPRPIPDVERTTMTQPEGASLPVPTSPLGSSPPGTMFLGSRTANSSPGPDKEPFYPPSQARDGDGLSSLRRDVPPANVRSWQSHIYHPGRGHIESSDLSHGIDPMTLSYPFAGTHAHHPYSIHVHPPAQARGPVRLDGYTSEPMTRDPSAQSSRQPGSAAPAPSTHRSSSPRGSAPSPHSLPVASQAQYPHVRRPSFIETEPSPHTGNAFPDVHTSYERWQESRGPGSVRRPRADSGSGSRAYFPAGSSPARRLMRGSAGFGSRSQSQSPSGARRPLPPPLNFQAPAGSPDLGTTGAESMERSVSGGIKLQDGRIIEFGQIAVDVELARSRARGEHPGREARAVSPTGSEEEGGEEEEGAVGLGIAG